MQVCTSLLTDNHASTPSLCFFTGRMPFLPPKQQTQITEGNVACWLEFYCFADGYYFDGDVFVGYGGCHCQQTLSSALGSFENMVVFYALIICYFRIFPSSHNMLLFDKSFPHSFTSLVDHIFLAQQFLVSAVIYLCFYWWSSCCRWSQLFGAHQQGHPACKELSDGVLA